MAQEQTLTPVQELEAPSNEVSEFTRLISKPVPASRKTVRANEVERALGTIAEWVLKNEKLRSGNVLKTVQAIMSGTDKMLSEQINSIMHHEDFQQLESTWRGLHYLVNNTKTDETLKIRVLNMPKKELIKTIEDYEGVTWTESPLFKKIHDEGYGTFGGEPYACLIGDYYFEHSPQDVTVLNGMAQIAAAAHAPFISGTSATLMNMESWQELNKKNKLSQIFETADYAPWRSLRDSEDSRYLGLTMPRFLARLPYGAKTKPVSEFAFEEDTDGSDHSKYLWSNAAYAMGTNINRAFSRYGWCAAIRGVENGGIVEGLPCHTFPTDDGGVDMKCPTEITFTESREVELAKNGLMSLSHRKNTDYATFFGASSLQRPAEYDDPEATENAKLAARMSYLFATCRFAHYLKCIVRDKIGTFAERKDMEDWLNRWIAQYVNSDPTAPPSVKAQYPLAAAQVVVEEVEGDPGYYSAKFFLRPHFQLEGLSVSLRLVSKVPSANAAK